MKPEKKDSPIRLNFLLGCSEHTLDNFRLVRMSAAANLRQELLALVDKLVDERVQIELALWFKENDRETLKRALETEESAAEWANRMIRGGHEIVRLGSNPQAHRDAAMRYQRANIAEGRCKLCPRPLDRNSTQHCTKHLKQKRERQREKAQLAGKPPRGKHPNTLASLERNRGAQKS
jgi:hypothetical protein